MINIFMIGVNSIEINKFAVEIERIFKLDDIPANILFFSDIYTFISKLDFRDFKCDIAFICNEACGESDLEAVIVRHSNIQFVYISDNDSFSKSAAAHIRKSDFNEKIDKVAGRLIQKYAENNKYIFFKNLSGTYRIPYNEILYIESFSHNIVIHCTDGREIKVTNSLNRIESEVAVYGFCRIHSGIIVNMEYIYSVRTTELVVKCSMIEKLLPISRNRNKHFKERYQHYIDDMVLTV